MGSPGSIPALSAAEKKRLLELARETLERRLGGRPSRLLATPSGGLAAPGAAFVTLRTRSSGELRGCCGEMVPRGPLVESVISMALTSARHDPRFLPVHSGELEDLSIEITVLGPCEPIRPDEVEVGRHGLAIERGSRRGVLLPQVPVDHGWDRTAFLTALCRKAGLADDCWSEPGTELLAFEALSWGEGERPPR